MGGIIGKFFGSLQESGVAFVNFLTQMISSIWGLFYVEETGFTSIGLFAIVTVAVAMVFMVVKFIRKLIHLRG